MLNVSCNLDLEFKFHFEGLDYDVVIHDGWSPIIYYTDGTECTRTTVVQALANYLSEV